MNQIIAVGTSHHVASLDFRERLAFSENQIFEAFRHLREGYRIQETVILSTCNRVEIYASTGRNDEGSVLFDFLSNYCQIDLQELKKFTYSYCELDAIRHLFRVSTSLDSMVVGEPQILGQVKEAYDRALSAEASGTVLNRLFAKAISVGKRIRTDTNIASGAVSISYAAVELAKKIFQSLNDKTVAILGAGEMSELTAQHLVDNGASKVIVANRTYEHAVKMAEKFNGTALAFDGELDFLVDADIVISSTNAPHYLIHRRPLAEIMKKRKHRYMFLIDIAVPRDIDPEVGKVNNAFLYNIDDLENVVVSNLEERQREATIAEGIVKEEAAKFHSQLRTLEVNPAIKGLHEQFQQIASKELSICCKKAQLSLKQQKAVESMTQAIIKKLLHQPTKNLRRAVNEIDKDHVQYVQALQELFGLENASDDGKDT
ncbi:glutamyl-tRNA reductase [Candidatus Poribacteria bacterium]|nr:glutamyl-tRNA reductase [Candidatus Poribacteria bacterium]